MSLMAPCPLFAGHTTVPPSPTPSARPRQWKGKDDATVKKTPQVEWPSASCGSPLRPPPPPLKGGGGRGGGGGHTKTFTSKGITKEGLPRPAPKSISAFKCETALKSIRPCCSFGACVFRAFFFFRKRKVLCWEVGGGAEKGKGTAFT